MVEYVCEKCGKLTKAHKIRNVGSKQKPIWVCEACAIPIDKELNGLVIDAAKAGARPEDLKFVEKD
jgi:protein-arginine kinase activator protein McsA